MKIQLASDAVDALTHLCKNGCVYKRMLTEEQVSDFGNLFRCLCNLFETITYKMLPLALDLCAYLLSY